MSKKKLRTIKTFSFMLLFIFIVEIIYIVYSIFYNNHESLYFNGINSVTMMKSSYVAVGSNNNNDNHYEKAKLSVYDKNKEASFEKLYSVGYNSTFFGVITDNNSIVAVGSYEKSISDHNESVRRGLLVKYSLDGSVEFDVDFKLLDNSKFTNIAMTNDGYFVTGQSVYKNTKVGYKEGGAVILKYDLDGNLLWYKTYGNSKEAIYNDLLLVDNYIYAVGVDVDNIGIICKYDLDGNLLSSNDYKYMDEIGFSDIVNIGDNIYVTGSNCGEKNLTNAMIVRYDLDCNYLDQVIYKADGNVRFNKLVNDDQNNIIVIGSIVDLEKTTTKTVDDLSYDGIIGKYNSDLEEISVVTYGDEKDDFFTDIILVNDNYMVVGYSSYEDGSYLSKFITYSKALKVLEVN